VREEFGIAPDALVLGTVATLRPYKGVDVLVRAGALLVDRFPNLRILVAGGDEGTDTSVREGLRELIDELGVADNVILMGFRADIPDVIEAMDIGVNSSDFEGSPLSVMEYMEAGKPVVATAVGGVPDLITEGAQGLLVPRRDPEALAAALAELLADPDRRAEMGASGRQRRRREFSVEATVDHVADLYEQVAGARTRASA
jgi:glycosyltransferase involved in cell wall biosynthesis